MDSKTVGAGSNPATPAIFGQFHTWYKRSQIPVHLKKGEIDMNLFKALFSFQNTNHIHKSIIALSFLATLVLILVQRFFIELVKIFGQGSAKVFASLANVAESGLTFTLIVFIISYLVSVLKNVE